MKNPACSAIKPSLLLLTLAASLLTGCSPPKVPGCTEQEPQDVLKKIALNVYQQMKHDPEKHQHSITSIRTRSTDDKTGAHECAADFVVTNSKNNKSVTFPITYKIEKLDNSNDLVHVEASGLKEGIGDMLFFRRVEDPIKMSEPKGY